MIVTHHHHHHYYQREMRTVDGYRSKEAGTYIGPQYDPQVELQGLSVLFKYLLLPSRRHFALGLRRDDEML